jgi:hypothetical protein
MAIYVPRARRRRHLILVGAAGLVLGAVVGGAAGRSSAPTVEARVRSVRSEARDIASELRVVSLHEGASAASLAGGSDAGAELALHRAETGLRTLFRRAPWIPSQTAGQLIAETTKLEAEAPAQARSEAFGHQVDGLADLIESTFGDAN